MRTVTVGVPVDVVTVHVVQHRIEAALQSGTRFLMTFANPGSAMLLRRNPHAISLFEAFDLVAPDGIAMVWAVQWLHRVPAVRLSFDFSSLAPFVFCLAAKQGARVVLVGGQPGVAEKAQQQLIREYPDLTITGVFDGYRSWCQTIQKLAPDIVICGMGGMLQESFLLELSENGWTGLGFTCGGFFDQIGKKLHYYPKWIDRLNLRWAYRLVMEPRRLWRRYVLDYPMFALSLCKAMICKELV